MWGESPAKAGHYRDKDCPAEAERWRGTIAVIAVVSGLSRTVIP